MHACRYATQCGATGGCRYDDTGLCQQLPGSSTLIPECIYVCLNPSPFLPPSPPPPPVFNFPPLPPSPPPPPPSPPPGSPSACGTCAELGPCQLSPSFAVCSASQSCVWQFNGCRFNPNLGFDVPLCILQCVDGPFSPSPPPPVFPNFPPLAPVTPSPPSPPPGAPALCATCDAYEGPCSNFALCTPPNQCSWQFNGCTGPAGQQTPICNLVCFPAFPPLSPSPPPPPPSPPPGSVAQCATCDAFEGPCSNFALCTPATACTWDFAGCVDTGTGGLTPSCNLKCTST